MGMELVLELFTIVIDESQRPHVRRGEGRFEDGPGTMTSSLVHPCQITWGRIPSAVISAADAETEHTAC
jgi:hypothetical protein